MIAHWYCSPMLGNNVPAKSGTITGYSSCPKLRKVYVAQRGEKDLGFTDAGLHFGGQSGFTGML